MKKMVVDWGVPIFVFILYVIFYNFGKINPSEMVKTTGLAAISMLALTLLVGPASHFMLWVNSLKMYRKAWGISSFLFVFAHLGLVMIYYMKWNIVEFVNPASPKFPGLIVGLLAFGILLVVTLISNQKAMKILGGNVWKTIQRTSVIALFLSLLHFYLMEQNAWVLVIRRSFGRIAFGFALIIVIVRFMLFLFPRKKR